MTSRRIPSALVLDFFGCDLREPDAPVQELARLVNVKRMIFYDCRMDRRFAQAAVELPKLETITLSTSFPEEGLRSFSVLTRLRALHMSRMVLRFPLRDLRELPALEELSFSLCELPAANYGELADLDFLKELSLACTNVNEECLPHLAMLVRLEELDLSGTNVTADGAETIQNALPYCRVNRPPPAWQRAVRSGPED